jgi:PAS domain S-box-containing protein
MRVSSLFKFLKSKCQRLWPRKIINKIAITNVVILLITICGLSWYALIEKSSYQINSTLSQHKEYAAQIARVSKNYIETDSVDELEDVISSFMTMDGTYEIYIKDVGFNTLLVLRYSEGEQDFELNEEHKKIAPVESGQFVRESDGVLEIWQQIAAENPVGWIYINRVLEPLNGLTLDFVKITLAALIFSIAVCLLMLQGILREPMRSLRRATEFSEWLDMAQGNHLQLKTSSKEVEQLVRTLNKTSEKLFKSGLADKRNHLLVDTIRDVQTRFIEGNKIQEINDRILNKVVQLSESEYGFFGEVLQKQDGKPFVKMHTFSKLSNNVSMQNFIEQHSPPNMEFHNTHNLFGAVLQSKKSTIANDPMRDPRSGGLPPGHPPVHSFMALPIFYGDEIVAVIGIANRRGGYDQSLMDYLQPLLTTTGHIVVANRHNMRRKDAMRELEQKEALFRRILSTVSDSIITINMGGFIETVNPATEKMFGYLREEMLSQNINQLIPDLYQNDFKKQYLNHEVGEYHERIGRRKDGSSFSIEFTVSEFKIGDEQMFTVTIIDISHLQNVSPILGQVDKNFVDIQRMVHAGTWELDLATNQVGASEEVYHIFNLESCAVDLNIHRMLESISQEDQLIAKLAIENCAKSNEPFVIDLRLTCNGAVKKFVQMQGNPQCNAKGEVTNIIGVIQDVTDTRQMMILKDEFITSVSEEIRSPLTSIRGSIGLLSGEVSKYISEKEKFLLDTAYQNTDRLLLLINDILDIENIATGKTEFNMEFLECKKLLDNVLMANAQVEKDYRVKFNLDVKNKDIVLIADKQRLMQLFSILALNAAKHSPMESKIDINAEIVDDSLLITVQDYGEGIPVDRQPALFDLYARTKYFQQDQPESTGLGLCVAKSIVDRHKGSIDLHSQPGKGTTFFIRLPVPQQNVAVLNL